MSLKDQITSDMRDAMRAHDKEKLSALRMLLSSDGHADHGRTGAPDVPASASGEAV